MVIPLFLTTWLLYILHIHKITTNVSTVLNITICSFSVYRNFMRFFYHRLCQFPHFYQHTFIYIHQQTIISNKSVPFICASSQSQQQSVESWLLSHHSYPTKSKNTNEIFLSFHDRWWFIFWNIDMLNMNDYQMI